MSCRSTCKHMQWVKYGAAADVCTDSSDFRHCHHYALVHIYARRDRSHDPRKSYFLLVTVTPTMHHESSHCRCTRVPTHAMISYFMHIFVMQLKIGKRSPNFIGQAGGQFSAKYRETPGQIGRVGVYDM